jgi:hypothetical protein
VAAYCCSAAGLADVVVEAGAVAAFRPFPYVLKTLWAQTCLFCSDAVVDNDFARAARDSDDLARLDYSTWWVAADFFYF